MAFLQNQSARSRHPDGTQKKCLSTRPTTLTVSQRCPAVIKDAITSPPMSQVNKVTQLHIETHTLHDPDHLLILSSSSSESGPFACGTGAAEKHSTSDALEDTILSPKTTQKFGNMFLRLIDYQHNDFETVKNVEEK